jgi:hypothetical protein
MEGPVLSFLWMVNLPRSFPPPWTVKDIGAAFVVRDHRGGKQIRLRL